MGVVSTESKGWPLASDIADCCRSVRAGTYRSADLLPLPVTELSLRNELPPVPEQSVSATCTAHAVAALVAYAENPAQPPALSAQFLFDQVKRAEDAWIERNLDSIRYGMDPDREFGLLYGRPYERLKRLVAANGGLKSGPSQTFLAQFEEQLRTRTGVAAGSLIHRCFEVVRECGVCSEELCPAVSVQRQSLAGEMGLAEPSRELVADAARHRVPRGLRLLEHPNSVNEIRKILVGVDGLRPMPVCVAIDLFDGCTEGEFDFPEVGDDGKTMNRPLGLHEVLLVGFADNATEPGGGSFIVRNSWGTGWGEAGYGRMSYAYLEIFCREAGTIQRRREQVVSLPAAHSASNAGGVCAICGKTYYGGTSLRFECEEPGCGARICFDCHERKMICRCQKHMSGVPREA